jgi:hypothetical protein
MNCIFLYVPPPKKKTPLTLRAGLSAYLIDCIGASPHIKIVDKVCVYFIGGIVTNNTTTVSEIIGAFAVMTFPSSLHAYGGHVLFGHMRFWSFYKHSLVEIFCVLARISNGRF